MAKSLRSKRQKRLRTLRREIVQPFYDNKEAAKLAVQEAALNAPKLPIPPSYISTTTTTTATTTANTTSMDVEMADGRNTASGSASLKPVGGVGKKRKHKSKGKKEKRHGKGKIRKKNI
ncbi:uncharacterized protein LOC131221150 [Magnolia sinica]|uniref:uncharacterized protein LOC131221150 n=1 Tax=Magnolia sinica TaxID=86752 RepID=UPI002659C81B|nr:uncharacterized protein LOC131221150 [Magnolia sinica]